MKHSLVAASALAIILGSGSALASGGAHWGYEGHEGPEHWGDISAEFATCKTGQTQSPINIESKGIKKGDVKPIEFHYNKMSNPKVTNNGHTLQVNYAEGSYAMIGGKKYNLLQFHFHAPSEETIDGKHGDLNVHLVHKSDDGKLAVVGVLLNKGKSNSVMKTISGSFSSKAGDTDVKGDINAADLLPSDKNYFNFQGSLTTPPCSEGVNWNVMKNPVTVSETELKAYTSIFKHTNRPTQKTNNRSIVSSN